MYFSAKQQMYALMAVVISSMAVTLIGNQSQQAYAVTYFSGGGECPAGEIPDCNGNCAPAKWVGDGICDDGWYEWNGNIIDFSCEEFDCDGGDCDCGGVGDGTCCVNGGCLELNEDQCESVYGTFNDESCNDVQCEPYCPADVTGDGVVDVSDLLAIIGVWGACP